MLQACTKKIKDFGGNLVMESQVKNISFLQKDKKSEIYYDTPDKILKITADHLISSAPLRELVLSLDHQLPQSLILSAKNLNYRDFITVVIITKNCQLFDDNWIYIHDPSVKVGRIQNIKSWSPYMVPDSKMACYGLEYFYFFGDDFWETFDTNLIKLAKDEMVQLGLLNPKEKSRGYVIRQDKAYDTDRQDYKGFKAYQSSYS